MILINSSGWKSHHCNYNTAAVVNDISGVTFQRDLMNHENSQSDFI